MPLFPISVILVRPQNSGNIGAIARAMMNMGFNDLILVDPEASHLNREAMDRAIYTSALLKNARLFSTLKEATGEFQSLVATSGKTRVKLPLTLSPREWVQTKSKGNIVKTAIVFGPEDRGLENEDLKLCDTVLEIPSTPEFPSLNLSHAVMVILYELACLTQPSEVLSAPESVPATSEQREAFFDHLKEALLHINFVDPHNPERIMKDLRNLFYRAQADERELTILRGICRQILNRCKGNGE